MEEKKEPHESKFEADFIVDICTEEVRDNFIKDFEVKAGTNFNISKSQRIGKGGSKQKLLKCTRNVRSKLSEHKQNGGKGSGSGPISGVEKQNQKNQQPTTTTTISVKLTDCDTNHEGSDIYYRLHINLIMTILMKMSQQIVGTF